MRFLIDESTGSVVSQELSKQHDVKYVGDVALSADDDVILKIANDEKRVLVTNDKDFGELVYKNKLAHSGVILLRLKINNPQNRLRVLQAVISDFGDKIAGHFVVATEDKIRIRS